MTHRSQMSKTSKIQVAKVNEYVLTGMSNFPPMVKFGSELYSLENFHRDLMTRVNPMESSPSCGGTNLMMAGLLVFYEDTDGVVNLPEWNLLSINEDPICFMSGEHWDKSYNVDKALQKENTTKLALCLLSENSDRWKEIICIPPSLIKRALPELEIARNAWLKSSIDYYEKTLERLKTVKTTTSVSALQNDMCAGFKNINDQYDKDGSLEPKGSPFDSERIFLTYLVSYNCRLECKQLLKKVHTVILVIHSSQRTCDECVKAYKLVAVKLRNTLLKDREEVMFHISICSNRVNDKELRKGDKGLIPHLDLDDEKSHGKIVMIESKV